MTTNDKTVWRRAVKALAGMCVADEMGIGPTKEAFIMTLRVYADEMEKDMLAERERVMKEMGQ
jgi:hypothetical protein